MQHRETKSTQIDFLAENTRTQCREKYLGFPLLLKRKTRKDLDLDSGFLEASNGAKISYRGDECTRALKSFKAIKPMTMGEVLTKACTTA